MSEPTTEALDRQRVAQARTAIERQARQAALDDVRREVTGRLVQVSSYPVPSEDEPARATAIHVCEYFLSVLDRLATPDSEAVG